MEGAEDIGSAPACGDADQDILAAELECREVALGQFRPVLRALHRSRQRCRPARDDSYDLTGR